MPRPRRPHLGLLLLLSTALVTAASPLPTFLEVVADTQNARALSGCEVCQQTSMCTQAFHNQPGQFCHALASGRPCCCPADAECVANVYSCRCRMRFNGNGPVPANPPPNPQQPVRVVTKTTTTHESGGGHHWLLFILSILAFCLCCGCCCRSHEGEPSGPEYQQPVYVTNANTGYGTAQPVYEAKPYIAPGMSQPAPVYGYAAPSHDRGGNALAAGAVGGIAGLASGMMIGSMLGGRRDDEGTTTTTTTTEYFDGDTGYGNNATSAAAYEFNGDTGTDGWGGGGGGFDGGFAGDDGDGGTFDGDV